MYYRVAYKGISEEDYNSKHPIKGVFSKVSIIILDNKFVKVGEVELDDYKFWPEKMFFTKEGVNIIQMDFENENSLKISVMKLIKK